MRTEDLQKIALLRFSLIAPVVNDTFDAPSKMQFYRNMAAKKHTMPDGSKIRIAPGTIKRWHMLYNRFGIDGLVPKTRNDLGKPRVLDDNAIQKIQDIKEQYPYITGKMVYQKLLEEGYIKLSNTSLASVHRYIRDNNLKRNQVVPIERRAFEMEFTNDCWQSDTSYGPQILINGRKTQTFLICLIDDASRLVTHAQFFLRDNSVNLQEAFKKAILKYGVPKKLFVDNGSSYSNGQLNMICASLGVVLIHTRVYSPESKGKIERVFRTFKDNYINIIDWNLFESLEHLNSEFNKYLNNDYTNKMHSATNDTPRNRYQKDLNRIKYKTDKEIDDSFLHRFERKVRNDATVSLNTIYFEVPQRYIGQRINIRYSPIDLGEAYIFDINNILIDTIYPLKKIDNSKIKRNNIDYSQMIGDKKHV
jgi:transposase InsO family protein